MEDAFVKWGFGAAIAFYVIRELFKLVFSYKQKNASLKNQKDDVEGEIEKYKIVAQMNNQSSIRHEKIVDHLGDMTKTLADIDRTTYTTNKKVDELSKDMTIVKERLPSKAESK